MSHMRPRLSLASVLLAGVAAAALLSEASASSGSGKSGSDKAQDSIDRKVEDKVESQASGKIEQKTEQKVEQKTEQKVEQKTEQKVEQKTEQKVEQKTEQKVEQRTEQKVDEKVGDKVEQRIEIRVDDRAGSGVSGKIETAVEKKSGDAIESRIGDATDDAVGERAQSAGSGAVDRSAERQAKAQLDAAEKALDIAHKAALAAARDAFDAAIASGVDQNQAKLVYDAQKDAADATYVDSRAAARADYEASRVAGDGGSSNSGPGGGGGSGSSNSGPGSSNSGSGGGSSNSGPGSASSGHGNCESGDDSCAGAVAAQPRFFEEEIDESGRRAARGEWLMLANAAEAQALRARGYETYQVDDLAALGAVLLRVRARPGVRLADAEREIRRTAPKAKIDYNHVYEPDAGVASDGAGASPASLLAVEGLAGARIGVIDTAVDLAHQALRKADVVARDFVAYENARPATHGTGVVSILVGDGPAFQGVARGAKILEASVFFSSASGGVAATASSIVKALDWLVSERVPVVSMSLSGPRNDILESALARAQARGLVVVAAVGNEGPAAPPQYPAAYAGVVGVTAVNRDKQAWRLAGRGAQVDFAAPGVGILHAEGSGFAASSGTSMATPFVAAAVAAARLRDPDAAVDHLARAAEDLGAAGRDPVYGYGFIRPLP